MMKRRQLLLPILTLSTLIACDPGESPAAGTPAVTARTANEKLSATTPFARRLIKTQAYNAYRGKDFASCASFFEKLGDAYRAGSCHAQAGDREAAFAQIALAMDGPIRDLEELEIDKDFAALAGDARWASAREKLAARLAEAARRHHPELFKIYEEDQADRKGTSGVEWSQVGARDRVRRERVDAILAAGGAHSALDYFRAAMVYQHGETVEHIQRARELALAAVEADAHNDVARWLAAAAEDRVLTFQDKPQKWGTQFKKIDGVWVVMEVDPSITDAQRAEQNVPSLAEAQARAARMNAAETEN